MSILEELKRRNVFRVGVAYIIVAWLLAQVADLFLDNFGAPDWVIKSVLIVLVLGFPLAIFFAWAFEMTPEGLKREQEVDRSQSITHQTGRKLDRAIIAIMALALAYFAYDKFGASLTSGEPSAEQGSGSINVIEPDPFKAEKSIAVLPFTNMSDDASNEFFADGISEEILNALAQVKELKVAGRTSAFAFKGQNQDLRQIGEALGVNHVLEGSVRKAGNKVRVTAQLIQVSDGFHLWSNTWDRELDDIFAIQDEIAGAILSELQAELVGNQSIASERVDPVLYEKYLRAKQRAYARTTLDLEIAAKLLQEVTEADPGFAAAWAQRAIVTMLLAEDSYGSIPHAEAQRQAKSHLDRALEIDENQPEALAGMGLYLNNQPGGASVREEAAAYLARALSLNPSLIDASNWLQTAYASMGRVEDAQRILEAMFDRDPLYKPGTGNLIFSYMRKGETGKADNVLDRIRPFIRDEAWLARFEGGVLAAAGKYGEAYPRARFGAERDPESATAQNILAFTMQGLGMDEELLQLESPVPYFEPFSLLRLDRREEALLVAQEWADRLGDPTFMIDFLHRTSQAEELVEYAGQRWPDLDKFVAEYPSNRGFGYGNMLALAHAYRHTGDTRRYEQALDLARTAHDRDLSDGFDTQYIQLAEAAYWAIAGNAEQSLKHLELALDKGGFFPLSDLALVPEFDELRNQARFRKLALRAHEQFNQQRVIAGLEPVEAEWPPLGG
jgi:TolB-like protein